MARHIEETENPIITDFASPSSEAIQKLQTNISFAGVDKPVKVLAFTSSVQAEGKSSLVVNLANIYAERGAKVLIINLDLRRSSIHTYYKIKNTIGVQEYVSGEAEKKDILVHLPNGVDIINSGTRTPFPTKVLVSPKLPALVKELRPDYDYILIDNAPVLLVTDAMLCANYVDGFIFVCCQHTTKKKDVANAIKVMKSNHVNIIGTVMTKVTDFRSTDDSSDSYYYYYDKKEGED